MASGKTEQPTQPPRVGVQVLKTWFDRLEVTLHNQAELAGLLGHGTMIGSAREFFVSRVLRSILPPSIHIGTGRVVALDGISKQIDIILYDPRCPLMEVQSGVGLYFIEGVIATVEVKSKLTAEKLRESLNNCYSVSSLGIAHRNIEPANFLAMFSQRMKLPHGLTGQDAAEAHRWALTPKSYVFSFTTAMTAKTIMRNTMKWYDIFGQRRTP